MNIKYARNLTVSLLTLLIAGGSVMWWLESSPQYGTTAQQSHPASRVGDSQRLDDIVIETAKQDRYQELENRGPFAPIYHGQ